MRGNRKNKITASYTIGITGKTMILWIYMYSGKTMILWAYFGKTMISKANSWKTIDTIDMHL